MWINFLQKGSGIITPLLIERLEQMYWRKNNDYLLVMFELTALLSALLLLWEEECQPQGERGPIPDSLMSCVDSMQSNQMPKLRPCTPISVGEHGCFTVQSGVCVFRCTGLCRKDTVELLVLLQTYTELEIVQVKISANVAHFFLILAFISEVEN